MSIQILDPTHEKSHGDFALATRLSSLRDARVGIISNGKEGTKAFFSALDAQLKQAHGVAEVIHRVKSNYSAPADAHIVEEAVEWDALIAGIGD